MIRGGYNAGIKKKRIMNKKAYNKPSMTVVPLHHKTRLLVGSDPVRGVPEGWKWGDPGEDR